MNKSYAIMREVIITGKAEEKHEAFNFLVRNDYRVISSGPIILKGGMKIDDTRFKIVAVKYPEVTTCGGHTTIVR